MDKIRRIISLNCRYIAYRVRSAVVFLLMSFLDCFTIVDRKKVIFSNFYGKGYGGNPRAIADELHRRNNTYKILWLSDNKTIDDSLPDYVIPIRSRSLKYYYELSTSGVWVFNQPIERGTKKRKNQLYIQTLHGDRTPKKVYYQNIGKRKSDIKHAISEKILDYGVTGSKAGEKLFVEGLGFSGKLIKYGCPRNDCLINSDDERINSTKKYFCISKDERILLYAPTFRQGNKTLYSGIDLSSVLNLLENKTGEKWCCLYRTHFHTKSIVFETGSSGRIIQASHYPDMADLLMIADFLITDYSSSAGDFCLTGKPEILFVEDVEEYTREFSFRLEDSPQFIANNQKELLDIIQNLSEEESKKNDEELKQFWGIYETGKASEKVVDEIISYQSGQ